MADTKVSLRYANSFLQSLIDKKNLSLSIEDANFILDAFNKNPQLRRALESPIVRANIKASIFTEIFKNKISEDSLQFVEFVISKNRVDLLFSILTRFLELCDEYNGIAAVEVKTAVELNTDQKEKLENKLQSITDKSLRTNYSVDSNVIGGFVAKIKDTVYDASLKHQLELMRKEFLRFGSSLN